jgi:hypothetical protein
MPWAIERNGVSLEIRISVPMEGEWVRLMDELQANLSPVPKFAHIPSRLEGGTPTDVEMLRRTWRSLQDLGIVIQTTMRSDVSRDRSSTALVWLRDEANRP